MAASIITSVKGDVTYDGIPDTVSLIGVQFGDSNAWQQMKRQSSERRDRTDHGHRPAGGRDYARPLRWSAPQPADKRDILLLPPHRQSAGSLIISFIPAMTELSGKFFQ